MTTALRRYASWSVERLITTPLTRSERRRREVALVRAVLRIGRSLDQADKAVRLLYARAAGNSKDLADPARRAELVD